MELTAKDMLERAYGKPLSEVEYQAMANNLSMFFCLLSKKKKENLINEN